MRGTITGIKESDHEKNDGRLPFVRVEVRTKMQPGNPPGPLVLDKAGQNKHPVRRVGCGYGRSE
jgi:hypothetical protein